MEHRAEIERIALDRGLDPALLEALVLKESFGDTYAWRPEPAYRYLWDVARHRPFRDMTPDEARAESAPKDFPSLAGSQTQEFVAQQASWGLCQVMGAVARELGYGKPYLTGLVDARINLTYGALLLKRLLTRLGTTELALQAYNGGIGGIGRPAPKRYAADVLTRYAALKVERDADRG